MFLSVFPACLLIAAATDIREFKIPNVVCAALALGYPMAAFAVGAPVPVIVEGLVVGVAALAVGFCLFAGRVFGAGDAKLIAAAAPWIGLQAMYDFVAGTVLSGGALAIVLMCFRAAPALPAYARAPWLMRMHQNRLQLPYGVAISVGGLFAFSGSPLFRLAYSG